MKTGFLKRISRMTLMVGAMLVTSVAALADHCPTYIEQGFVSGANFYTWRLEYVDGSYNYDGTTTTICYELTDVSPGSDNTRIVSHYTLGLPCAELIENLVHVSYEGFPLEQGEDGGFETGTDPTTGVTGIKIDSAAPGTYCFTFLGEFELDCASAALKNGNVTTPLIQPIVGLNCESGHGGGGGGEDSSISGVKFYDANANGIFDDGESTIAGWKVEVCIDVDGDGPEPGNCVAVYTDEDGVYSFDGEEGWSFTVYEHYPNETNWMQTYPIPNVHSGTFTDGLTSGLNFGNLCLGAGGGHTMGFWGNKNGQRRIDGDDLAALRDLNLVDGDGVDFDPNTKEEVKAFLRESNAVNMKYMLSAQLTAMVLNVREGFVEGDALVYAGDCGDQGVGNEFITISDLIEDANNALANPGATRDYLECLKDALDAANNDENFVQASPCPFTFS